MTEEEYKRFESMSGKSCPLYGDDNPLCESLERPSDSRYDTVREATTFSEALGFCRDPQLEFRGGIRYKDDNGTVFIYAYFWKKR